jgi:hypothetical protein
LRSLELDREEAGRNHEVKAHWRGFMPRCMEPWQDKATKHRAAHIQDVSICLFLVLGRVF